MNPHSPYSIRIIYFFLLFFRKYTKMGLIFILAFLE